MVAVVRNETGNRCHGWTGQEVIESYCLCPEPTVSLEEWIKAANIDVQLGNDELSEAYKRQQNSIAEKDFPSFAKVTDDG